MTDNIESSGRTIPRLYIGTTIPKAEDARVILGADALEEQVQEELIAITDLRKKCMVWAKDRVKQIQFEEAFEEAEAAGGPAGEHVSAAPDEQAHGEAWRSGSARECGCDYGAAPEQV